MIGGACSIENCRIAALYRLIPINHLPVADGEHGAETPGRGTQGLVQVAVGAIAEGDAAGLLPEYGYIAASAGAEASDLPRKAHVLGGPAGAAGDDLLEGDAQLGIFGHLIGKVEGRRSKMHAEFGQVRGDDVRVKALPNGGFAGCRSSGDLRMTAIKSMTG